MVTTAAGGISVISADVAVDVDVDVVAVAVAVVLVGGDSIIFILRDD